MKRRCKDFESCNANVKNARFAFFNLPIANHLDNPKRDWNLLVRDFNKNIKIAKHTISVDWKKFNPNDYIFSHCSIVASVATDETNYRILEPTDELVNANGNAWTNEVLPHCFRTFVGADNFYEHIQIPELSKGKIIDAVLRPVKYIGKNGKKSADVYFCDILVATNRIHTDIVRRILSNELNTLSMGAVANVCQCSVCGRKTTNSEEDCIHLKTQLNDYVIINGKRWKVAELCGVLDDNGNYVPDSCIFIEASWVENPAFEGAVINYLLEQPKIHQKVEQIFASNNLEKVLFDDKYLSQMKVADIYNAIAIRVALQEIRREKYLSLVKNVVR